MSFVRILCIGLGFGVGIGSSGVFYSASERLEVPDSLISAFRSRYPRLKEDELPEKNLQFHEQLKQLFLKAHKGQNRIDFRGFREMFGTDSEQFDRACFEIAKNGCDEDEIS